MHEYQNLFGDVPPFNVRRCGWVNCFIIVQEVCLQSAAPSTEIAVYHAVTNEIDFPFVVMEDVLPTSSMPGWHSNSCGGIFCSIFEKSTHAVLQGISRTVEKYFQSSFPCRKFERHPRHDKAGWWSITWMTSSNCFSLPSVVCQRTAELASELSTRGRFPTQ